MRLTSQRQCLSYSIFSSAPLLRPWRPACHRLLLPVAPAAAAAAGPPGEVVRLSPDILAAGGLEPARESVERREGALHLVAPAAADAAW